MPPKFDVTVLKSELHKGVRHKFEKRRVMVYAVNDTWASDLMDMQEWYHPRVFTKYINYTQPIFIAIIFFIPLLHIH